MKRLESSMPQISVPIPLKFKICGTMGMIYTSILLGTLVLAEVDCNHIKQYAPSFETNPINVLDNHYSK